MSKYAVSLYYAGSAGTCPINNGYVTIQDTKEYAVTAYYRAISEAMFLFSLGIEFCAEIAEAEIREDGTCHLDEIFEHFKPSDDIRKISEF